MIQRLFWIMLFAAVTAQTAPAAGPPAVQSFKARVFEALAVKADAGLNAEAKRDRIFALVDPAFDENIIIPNILEKTWPAMPPAEQAELLPYMGYVIKWKFIGKLFKYGVSEIKFNEQGPTPEGYELKGRVGGGLFSHPIRVKFCKRNQQWSACDMIVRGFSLTAHYRRKFDHLYDNGGLASLTQRLEKELAEEFAEMGL